MVFSIFFDHELEQQGEVPVVLSLREITDVFISHFSYYRYLKLLFKLP